jgi:hypothetical protein
LVEYVKPSLANCLIDKVKLKINSGLDGIESIEINLPPINPYVEYIKKINKVESDGIRVTFSIVLGGKLEDIRFRSNFRNRQLEVYIDRLIAYLTISIIKISVSILYIPTVTFDRPIVLGNNKQLFKMENLYFHLPM